MPRNSLAQARDTRAAILDRALEVASVDGLEGLTFGRLADDMALSKAGLVGHFKSKERLQLDTLARAVELFRRRVIEPSESSEPGMPRLLRICRDWSSYLGHPDVPGGCFLTSASFEFDDRPGAVREALLDIEKQWRAMLTREVRTAIAAGDLPADTDPRQIAFELMSVAVGATQAQQLLGDRDARKRCRAAMLRVLGR
jgi:AcrR family transcriptional regulator